MGRGIVLARQNKINEASTAFDQALAAAPSTRWYCVKPGPSTTARAI